MKRIVRGNDFTLRIPVMKSVGGEKVPFPIPACTDVQVRICNQFRRITLSHEVDVEHDNIILARVEGDQIPLGTYAIEVKGKILGNDWRSEEYPQFQIVSRNADSDLEFGETDEGDNSVEMDTALVILPPTVELSNLITDANTTIADGKQAVANIKATNSEMVAAEEERKESESGRVDAEDKRASSENDRIKAEEGRVSAEESRVTAEEARVASEEERIASENQRVESEKTRVSEETKRMTSESARVSAEDTRKLAEEVRISAETKRVGAENVREDNETERVSQEAARAEAETARGKAEAGRDAAETERVSSEKARQDNENARIGFDKTYAGNEASRVENERVRVEAENERISEEARRISSETARVSSENDRKAAETLRDTAEKSRVSAEDGRATAEQKRADAEESRVTAEGKRTDAETKREVGFANIKSGADAVIDSATAAASKAEGVISKCETAAAGAEKVDARLDGNVLTVTNRKGAEQSVNLTDSDEHVTVNLTTTVTGTTTEGLVLYVYINNGEDPQEYVVDSKGQAEFTVAKGSTYKVVFPYLTGCNPINPIQHVASVGNRIIDAEYIAEVEKLEHVTVKVRKADDNGSLQPWERFSVNVTISGKKTTYATDENGIVEFAVKNGTSYTVAVDKLDGMYEQYDRYSVTRTAFADSYRFNFIYRTYESGIWLIDDENKRYTYDELEASGNDKSKLMFVCIKTLDTQRYKGDIYIGLDALKDFSLQVANKQWCPSNVQFNSIPLNGQSTAYSVWSEFAYNGLHATETIIAEGDERELQTPACDYAYGFKVDNSGVTYQGYLPTVYQWSVAWSNIDIILDMLGMKFPDLTFTKSMLSGAKWTSTQSSATYAHGFNSSVYGSYKSNSYLAIPFFACLSDS